ncbi:MAG: hypothetical protein A2041_09050 [Bacteroidetes bacterium GWA2_31_9b]|nr:MAG: hypothetical protein A2041_09050 [Bacteroidetes bacterium GWA2_31_9b]
MKNSFFSVSISVASLGVFLVLTGLIFSVTNNSKSKQLVGIESFYWSFYTIPQDLIAQLKKGEVEKTSEKEIIKTECSNITKSESSETNLKTDSASVQEKGDSTKNNAEYEQWIQQIIQMNGCFDIYSDFVEKDWMKDQNFIIL